MCISGGQLGMSSCEDRFVCLLIGPTKKGFLPIRLLNVNN